MHSKLLSSSNQLIKSSPNLALVTNNERSKFEFKLWHLAVLIGVPSATILSYLLYKKLSTKQSISKNKQPNSSSNDLKKEKSDPKLDDVKKEQKPKTPLEIAVEKKNQGNVFFQAGKFDKAVECYSEAIENCPNEDKNELPKFFQNRAAAYENLKNYEKVVEDCTDALSLDPNYEKALTRRSKALENLNRLQEAFEDLTSLCILQKFSSSSMASADKMVKKIGEKMASEIFKNRNGLPISQHFVNNFFVGLNNDLIFKNPEFYEQVKNDENSVMRLAIDEFNSGDFTTCIGTCTKEIEETRTYVLEAKNLRGSLYMLKCQYKEARADFEDILNNDSASNRLKSNTYIKLTALNLQNGQELEAFENYDKAIQIDPTNEDIYCNRAQVFAMKGRFDESFKDFDKCLELNANHTIAKIQKAFFEFRQFFAQLSMYAQAIQSPNIIHESKELKIETSKLETLISQYSDVPEAYNLYAQILSEQEQFEKAEGYYKLALEKDPKNAALMVQRALNIMSWTNDFEEPVKMLNQAVEIDDTCEFAFETLATIEIQRGNLPRAVELFEKAIQLTRSEESMTNLCCMLVGAKTQFKVLNQLSQNPGANLDILNSISQNKGFF
ncbi:unnamed protein product [Brachionus calyciflorus]|uniref:Mitochondrial import receptor subunit TOM70 n=1 Tax=Brachionus calyciflorus TaxID=104777 RepID=A0A813V2G0_9BILA|nr:unnamed protein product [Brachionus calyciflorus]